MEIPKYVNTDNIPLTLHFSSFDDVNMYPTARISEVCVALGSETGWQSWYINQRKIFANYRHPIRPRHIYSQAMSLNPTDQELQAILDFNQKLQSVKNAIVQANSQAGWTRKDAIAKGKEFQADMKDLTAAYQKAKECILLLGMGEGKKKWTMTSLENMVVVSQDFRQFIKNNGLEKEFPA